MGKLKEGYKLEENLGLYSIQNICAIIFILLTLLAIYDIKIFCMDPILEHN